MISSNFKIFRYFEIFEIIIGKSSDLNKLEYDPNGINYVGRSEFNNGITSKVKKDKNLKIYQGNCITIPMVGNSTLKSSFQVDEFCVSQNIAILKVKNLVMSLNVGIYLISVLRKERFRFSYGRTLSLERIEMLRIKLPIKLDQSIDWDSIDKKVSRILKKQNNIDLNKLDEPLLSKNENNREIKWKWFKYCELFEIKKGKRIVNRNTKPGNTPCIRPIDANNGVVAYISEKPNHLSNTITVNYNGSVAEAYYQPVDYFALDDVNVLYPKFNLNPFIAMFLITLIRKEKYRFNYGRKWHLNRMKDSLIKLPILDNEQPNWSFMENFIKSLPYSSVLNEIQ